MSSARRPVLFAPGDARITVPDLSVVRRFHSQLPLYKPSPLTPLPSIASRLGVRAVFVKDESDRLGLPAFKILGASWGAFRAVASRFDLDPYTASFAEVAAVARERGVILFTASEGNHGRAIAAIARMMGITARIFVSHTVHPAARALIESEGAQVTVSTGVYEKAMMESYDAARAEGDRGLFVQDTSFEGYDDIPAWIVEGYSTLLAEVDEQLADQGLEATVVVTPVGVGSLGHAVVRHCKSQENPRRVVSVEPDTAASLYKAIRAGKMSTCLTGRTIMGGLNCGTPTRAPFDELRRGTDACVTVSDWESHHIIPQLAAEGVRSGPCGAATLAGLLRLGEDASQRPDWLSESSVIVILNTEGPRTYEMPLDVTVDDPVKLTQILTGINSANPDLSVGEGSSETAISTYIAAWLEHRDIETHWLERNPGRPSIVGVLRGSGGGRSIMLNGHIDTVSLGSYSPDANPLSGQLVETEDGGRIYGRGSLDMKSGLAASMAALARLAVQSRTGKSPLRGDVILAAVADEENFSKGTEDVLAAGWTADAAIIPEPTSQALVTSHKGFVWAELTVLGRAMHGSMPEEGVDAILLAGALQTALLKFSESLPAHPRLGKASLHGGLIRGGEEPSSYSDRCTLTVEFRTVPPQTPESVLSDLEALLERVASETPGFKYAPPHITFSRPASAVEDDHPFVKSFSSSVTKTTGRDAPAPSAKAFWCDAGLLNAAGIPSIVYGPSGFGLHAAEEWVSVKSLREVTDVLETVVRDFTA